MTATIAKGHRHQYLTEAVGKGAEHYYLKSIEVAGEPPGFWLGSGTAHVAQSVGAEVDPKVMETIYGKWKHPETGEKLGRAMYTFKPMNERLAEALAKEPEATPERVKEIELAVRKSQQHGVRYYDVTYSAPKSWSLLHASYQVRAIQAREQGFEGTAEVWQQRADAVWDAWKEGVAAGTAFLEREAGYSRAGYHGRSINGRSSGRYIEGQGLIVAAFAQHTSRNDDPQLHVHTAILNKTLTIDIDPVTGEERQVWRTLDGQALYRHTKAAGHMAERVAEEALYRKLGVRVATRPDGVAREVVGIGQDLRDHFSTRRTDITEGVAELVKAYEAAHGTRPDAHTLAKMAQFVNLDRRDAKKKQAPTRDALLIRWEQATIRETREALSAVPEQVAVASAQQPEPALFEPERVIERALGAVQEQQASWSRADLLVELARQLPDCLGGLEAQQVTGLLDELADAALDGGAVATVAIPRPSPHVVVRLSAPEIVPVPEELLRADGLSLYTPHGAQRYATTAHIEMEQRLLDAARREGAPTAPEEVAEAVIEARGLAGAQADFVRGVATSGRVSELLIGPAGTGKSYAVAALTEVWEQTHGEGSVLGLATSQRAVGVLQEEGLSRTANLAELLSANEALAEGISWAGAERFRIRPGQLVIVDEAGMSETAVLDQVRALVEAAGAKLLLAGDHAQLTAVGAGGAVAHLAAELPSVHVLQEVRRFNAVWEREASLQLREGETPVLEAYEAYGRLRGGTGEEMTARAYQGWLADALGDRRSLLIATTNEQATELAARARADLVRAGRVEAEGMELRDGTLAGVGDEIQMRRNNRNLLSASGGRFAVNRDVATVVARDTDDGSLVVRYEDGDTLRLPASYVSQHVELAYAGTVHSSQGRTVDTCHSLVDPGSSRESLYVSLTRGREANLAYVVTEAPAPGEEAPDKVAVLDQILQRTSVEQSALATLNAELERASHLGALHPVWADLIEEEAATRVGRTLVETLGADAYRRIASEEEYSSLARLARQVEDAGHDATDLLARAAGWRRGLGDADSYAAVMHHRLEREFERAQQRKGRSEQQKIRFAGQQQEQQVADFIGAQAMAASPFDVDAAIGSALTVGILQTGEAAQETKRAEIAAEHAERTERRSTWLGRTPQIAGAVGRYVQGLAQAMDQRMADLGEVVAQTLPRWAQERLGALPADPLAREEWAQRAAKVAAYRETYGHESEKDAIGPAPSRGNIDARAAWEAAYRALGEPADTVDVAAATDARLRDLVERYRREELWAPPHVADDLRNAHLARDDYRASALQLELRAKEDSEQQVALHEELVQQAMGKLLTFDAAIPTSQAAAVAQSMKTTGTIGTLHSHLEPTELEQEMRDRAVVQRHLATTMEQRAEQLETVHEARQEWYEHTNQTRTNAELARRELARRSPEGDAGTPAPHDRAQRLGRGAKALREAVADARKAKSILRDRKAALEFARQQAQGTDPALSAEELDRTRRDTAMDIEPQAAAQGRTMDPWGIGPSQGRQQSGPGMEL